MITCTIELSHCETELERAKEVFQLIGKKFLPLNNCKFFNIENLHEDEPRHIIELLASGKISVFPQGEATVIIKVFLFGFLIGKIKDQRLISKVFHFDTETTGWKLILYRCMKGKQP